MSNTIVRTNVPALNSHRNLGKVGNQQSKASARLSSGYRINSAADDAAGLGISEKMRSQIRGLDQASANAQDGISLIQTAEGAMSSVNEMVIRIRELVVKAANDTNAHDEANVVQSDRQRIQDEIDQLMDEIDSTRDRTEFNTRKLIDGTLGGTNDARLYEASDISDTMIPSSWGVDMSDAEAVANAKAYMAELVNHLAQSATESVMDANGYLNGLTGKDRADAIALAQKELETLFTQGITKENIMSMMGTIKSDSVREALTVFLNGVNNGVPSDFDHKKPEDLDLTQSIYTNEITSANWSTGGIRAGMAWFNSNRASIQRITEGGTNGVWFQVGANASQGVKLYIKDVGTNELNKISAATSEEAIQAEMEKNASLSAWMNANGLKASDFTFENLRGGNRGILHESGEAVNLFLHAIDSALSYVTAERSNLGAMQNRLEYTIENLDVASENLTASESRIRDADMAKEMMNLTQANVLQQAATSMLAQANQAPQNVLQLLG